jgi:glycosyltransferase involved in cell wall biosynthesis
MDRKENGITVVIPIYNEEDGIRSIFPAFQEYFERSNFEVQLLLVNDGSTDNSLSAIKELAAQSDKVHYLSFRKNAGLSAAIRAGIVAADTEWIGYIDADLQTDPIDFLKLESFLGEYDLVTGWREGRKDSVVKNMSSSFANWFRDSLLHDGVQDSGCPLKIMRRSIALDMPFFKGMHRFFPALVQLQNKRVKEVPVTHFPRVTGQSKFNLWNRLLSPFLDTMAVRWLKKRQTPYEIGENSLLTPKNNLNE